MKTFFMNCWNYCKAHWFRRKSIDNLNPERMIHRCSKAEMEAHYNFTDPEVEAVVEEVIRMVKKFR